MYAFIKFAAPTALRQYGNAKARDLCEERLKPHEFAPFRQTSNTFTWPLRHRRRRLLSLLNH